MNDGNISIINKVIVPVWIWNW